MKDSVLSNLQALIKGKTGPVAASYARNTPDSIAKANELMENLDDQSFSDVLADAANPDFIFVGNCVSLRSATNRFC